MKKFYILLSMVVVFFISCSGKEYLNNDGLYAEIKTNKGSIAIELYYDKVPITVANFVGLAEGTRMFTDPETKEQVQRPFYDGIIFHRIIDGFMIQTGDPLGNGMGGPGYQFINEIDPSLSHGEEGMVSMANAGPHTNGSQFFITLAPQQQLDGGYSVFGKVVDGMDIVKEIGGVKVGQNDKPYNDVFIKNIDIHRVGEDAESFDAEAVFATKEEVREDMRLKVFNDLFPQDKEIVETKEKMKYAILKEGTGPALKKGDKVKVHYTGYFELGGIFDSSRNRNQPFELTLGQGRVIEGWEKTLATMKAGEKRIVLIPYYLAYGERGTRGIPPKSDLYFEMEVVELVK